MKSIPARLKIGAVALFLYLAAFGYLPESSPIAPQNEQDQSTGDGDDSSDVPPTEVQIVGPVELNGPIEVQGRAQEDQQAFLERAFAPETVPSWILTVAAIFATVLAGLNLRHLRKQTGQLERQTIIATNPRLSCDGVRVSHFHVGEKPVFFLDIRNSGPADATDIEVVMNVRWTRDGTLEFKGKPHTMTIPANSVRVSYLAPNSILTKGVLPTFANDKRAMSVYGHFGPKDGEKSEYCYRYCLWPDWDIGNRPDGVPLFIPCDMIAGVGADIIERVGTSGTDVKIWSATGFAKQIISPAPKKDDQ